MKVVHPVAKSKGILFIPCIVSVISNMCWSALFSLADHGFRGGH